MIAHVFTLDGIETGYAVSSVLLSIRRLRKFGELGQHFYVVALVLFQNLRRVARNCGLPVVGNPFPVLTLDLCRNDSFRKCQPFVSQEPLLQSPLVLDVFAEVLVDCFLGVTFAFLPVGKHQLPNALLRKAIGQVLGNLHSWIGNLLHTEREKVARTPRSSPRGTLRVNALSAHLEVLLALHRISLVAPSYSFSLHDLLE